jgi:DNA-binding response OmpR family regulator
MSSISKEDAKKLKVIIVDDNALARKTVSSILEQAGFTILAESESAQKALYLAKSNPAHLYIVDVVMPDKSGVEFTKELNEITGTKWVILMSSLTSDHIMIEAVSCGACDYIKKPFDKNDLLRSVEKIYYMAKAEKAL